MLIKAGVCHTHLAEVTLVTLNLSYPCNSCTKRVEAKTHSDASGNNGVEAYMYLLICACSAVAEVSYPVT